MDTSWLKEVLVKERDEVLELLEGKHRALIAAFERNYADFVGVNQAFDVDEVARNREIPSLGGFGGGGCENGSSPAEVEVAREDPAVQDSERGVDSTSSLLLRAFDSIDKDKDGKVRVDEFREALQAVGQSPARALNMIRHIEALCKGNDCVLSGVIDRDEWMRLVSGERRSQLDPQIFQVAEKYILREKKKPPRFYCMLSPHSSARLAWDCLCAICTLYVITAVPLWLTFGMELLISDTTTVKVFSGLDNFIDAVFLFDIILNFRTGYITDNGIEELCWKKVGFHYLGSWLLLDVCSSIPVSFLPADTSDDMQSIKMVKFIRFFAIMRLLRAAKVFQILEETRVGEFLEERVIEYRLQTKMRIVEIALVLLACCHWLACAMAACGLDFIDSFIDGSPHFAEVYIPAFYWAMTTCTTVGYGDITPKTTSERIVAMIAMCIGGTFYGIISGTFTSIISSSDRAKQERLAKMQIVNSWLQRHNFPRQLRRRIRYHIKSIYSKKENCTKDELTIIEELTSQLRTEVSLVLVPGEVRSVPIFDAMPDYVTGFLVSILNIVSFKKHDVIVEAGACGASMYIVKVGHCEQELCSDPSQNSCARDRIKLQLYVGESFGEEIVLGFAEMYDYTVLAVRRSDLYRIAKGPLLAGMANYPGHLETMKNCFKSNKRHYAHLSDRVSKRISCTDLAPSNLPDDFGDSVLANLRRLTAYVEEIRESKMQLRSGSTMQLGSI